LLLVCVAVLVSTAAGAQESDKGSSTFSADEAVEESTSEEESESTPSELSNSNARRKESEESPTSSSDVHLHAGTLVGTRVGTFGRATEEFGGLLGARFGRLQVEEVVVWGSSSVSGIKSGASARITSLSTQGLVCYSTLAQRVDLYPCVGFDWTSINGRPIGFENVRKGSVSWLSMAIGAKLAWKLRYAWQLELAGLAFLAAKRPRAFQADAGTEDVPRAAALGSRIYLGLKWEFF